MGTRNLTIVRAKKDIKVCQYGQWDGYPTGQGETIAKFLRGVDLEKFHAQLDALGEYTDADIEKAYVEAGAEPGAQFVSMDISEKVHAVMPGLSRDHGAGILQLIHDGEVKRVRLYPEDYKNDSSCEYWYEIDLDDETVCMNGRTFTFEEFTREGKMEELEAEENNDD